MVAGFGRSSALKRSGFETPLDPYLDTEIRLFIYDSFMCRQVLGALSRLGFSRLGLSQVSPNYFEAMRQLFAELKGNQSIFLVNHPLQSGGGSHRVYSDPGFRDFFDGVASFAAGKSGEACPLLSRCLPVFIGPQDPEVRENLIKQLLPHGIMGAFMLQPSVPGMPSDSQIEERTQELFDYFLDYFRQRDNKLAQFREYKSAAELKEARIKANQIMREVAELKAAKDYDRAVALCRQAISVLPTDPEAYLEGGRILVRKRRFTSAMAMFRDAEAVAEAAPEPNQEIGNLRVEQVKEYLRETQAAGKKPDRKFVDGCLAEAVENFGAAMQKAEKVTAFDGDQVTAKRQSLQAALAENLLSLGLSEMVGDDNPHWLKMLDMARDKLPDAGEDAAKLEPKYHIQFGLMAFSQGDYDKAEAELFKACEYPETFDKAATKLNFVATQLRKMGRVDQAIRIYKKLLDLGPAYRGYVLLNLATALKSKSLEMLSVNEYQAARLEQESFGCAVEGLYLEPLLPRDDNFYHNSIMAPLFKKGQKLFWLAAKRGNGSNGDQDPAAKSARLACRQARQNLEALIVQGRQGEGIRMLFSLAKKLPLFFLEFDRHSSQEVLRFTAKLEPLLMDMADPRMQKLGKICGILVQKGRAAQTDCELSGNQELDQVITALNRKEPQRAAGLVAEVLYRSPEVIRLTAFESARPLCYLCQELEQVMSQISLNRFLSPLSS